MILSIVIPLYNEMNTVVTVIQKIQSLEFPDFITGKEIIIVDDASTDESYYLVNEYAKKYPEIKLTRLEKNCGKGFAVRKGFEIACGDLLLVQDADLELSPNDIPRMLHAMNDLKVEFVNGSRYLDGIIRPLSSFKRYFANKVFTLLTAMIIDVKITDLACGYKLIHRNLLNKLKLEENRFGIEVELIIKAMKVKKNNIAEVPVQYFPRNEGDGKKFKNTDAIKMLFTIVRHGILGKKTQQRIRNSFSKFAIFLIMLCALWYVFNVRNWKTENKVIYWDIISYYAYLPATFIYQDLTLNFTENYSGTHKFLFWPSKAPNGNKVIMTSMGLSILYAPFFFMAHAYAYIGGYDTGGYSIPYSFALIMAGIFYLGLGLIFLRKILLLYFSDTVTSFTIIGIALGTNLFYYSTLSAAMPHVFNFCLYAIFIYFTIKWHENQSIKNTVLIGLLAGLITLIRPTNILCLLFFALWNVVSFKTLKDKFFLVIQKPFLVPIMFIAFISVWFPQLIYWKWITGSWFFYSYGDSGNFFWSNPHIFQGLFGFRNGWLLYTPLHVFSIIGIFMLWRYRREYFLPVLTFIALNIYIILSWWCWWYTGLGNRAFIDSYAILAIPLAVFISWAFNKKKALKYLILIPIIFSFLLGAFYSVQYHYGAVHYNSMTKDAYLNSFGRIKPSAEYWKLLKTPDYEKAKIGIDAFEEPDKNK